MGEVPCIRTAGELKKALASIPDETPLAIENHGIGWGLKPPFVAQYGWVTDMHNGYVTELEAAAMRKDETKARPRKLDYPVCVLKPGTEHY